MAKKQKIIQKTALNFNNNKSLTIFVPLQNNYYELNFTDFDFEANLLEGLLSMGYKTPTPIQGESIPLIQNKHDLIACAQTGTGKTAAYLLPVMDAICKMEKRPLISALILAPTRELAMQIDQHVEGLGYFAGVSSIAIYGGGDGIGYEQQRRALREGVDIVIATPGRLIAHMSSGAVQFGGIQMLVLDEADRMLDMGFKDDINRIVRELPSARQTVMFSATMPPKIRSFAKTLLRRPKQVNIAISQPAEKIRQIHYQVHDAQKTALLKMILLEGDYQSIIVFSSTKEKVKDVYRELRRMKLDIEAFHSDLKQEEREELLLRFKNKQLSILIGTDVLSRGIDVEGIDLVVNFDVPPDPEDYIHRIGRTARAERTGTAITFVNRRDARRFKSIEELMERSVAQMDLPEALGPAPEETFVRERDPNRHAGKNSRNRRNQGRNKRSSNRATSEKNTAENVKTVEPQKTTVHQAQAGDQAAEFKRKKRRNNRNRQRNKQNMEEVAPNNMGS